MFLWVTYKGREGTTPKCIMTQESQSETDEETAQNQLDDMADYLKNSDENVTVEKHGYDDNGDYELVISTKDGIGLEILYNTISEEYVVLTGVWTDSSEDVTNIHAVYEDWETARDESVKLKDMVNLLTAGGLTRKQAVAYQLREEQNITRHYTAEIMGVSESTVDKHLSTARDKIAAARTIVDVLGN